MVSILKNEGMLDTIADGELQNKGNIEDKWLNVDFDNGRMHSIPYQWGSTSFMVNLWQATLIEMTNHKDVSNNLIKLVHPNIK